MAGAETIFATRTTTRLLDALRDPGNEPVWTHIDGRYRPILASLARRLGLRDSEAEEVAQQALTEFVRAYRDGRYDRTKGRLSSWIIGIAHHTALHALRDGKRQISAGTTAMVSLPDEHEVRRIWEEERDRAILERAMAMLRDEATVDDRTLLAFELFGLRGVPVGEVASRCGMTPDQVYVAKSRITKKLRHAVEQLTSAFEEDA
jgi:RNA polymerase sigma-70 factor (ECF subfamily)